MDRSMWRWRRPRVGRIAVALGIGAAAIPVGLTAFAEPSAAASSGGSTVSLEQVVADVECDAGWLVWDVQSSLGPLPGQPPFCVPVPSGLAR